MTIICHAWPLPVRYFPTPPKHFKVHVPFKARKILFYGRLSSAMKVKQESVCQTCRTRKLGVWAHTICHWDWTTDTFVISQCDGKRPGCSQCVHSGHKCSGYQTDWKFVSHTPIHTSTSGEQHGQARTARKEDRETLSGADQQEDLPSTGPMQLQHPLNQPSASNHTELITQSFVPGSGRITPMYDSDYMEPRICGSWVEVLSNLPCLTTKNSVLPNAVTALAASIPSQPRISNITCLQTYHTAIRTLRESFCVNRLTLDIEQIPAIMCLTLVEVPIIYAPNPQSLIYISACQLIEDHDSRFRRCYDITHPGCRPVITSLWP